MEKVGELKKDDIQFQSIAFKKDDKCRTAADHAKELGNNMEDFKRRTGANQVNIVGHSKGGLMQKRIWRILPLAIVM